MKVIQFEKQLQEIANNVPEGTTLFLTYSNDENSNVNIQFVHGKTIDLIADLSRFAVKNKVVRKLLTVSSDPDLIKIGEDYFNNEQ